MICIVFCTAERTHEHGVGDLRVENCCAKWPRNQKRSQEIGQIGYTIKQLKRNQDKGDANGADNLINWFTDGKRDFKRGDTCVDDGRLCGRWGLIDNESLE
jgi:hypothetical protein